MHYMKRFYLLFFVFLFGMHIVAVAQDGGISIGKGNADADPSAILELVSKNKGLLIPRLSSSERDAIDSPANGLIVYDKTLNGFYFWNSTSWKEIAGTSISSGSGFPSNAKENDIFYHTTEGLLYIWYQNKWEVVGSRKQILQLDGSTLKLLEQGKTTGSEIDLSVLFQNLSLSGTTLKISNGNSVDLASLFTDKDEQQLALSGSVLTLTNGGSVNFTTLLTASNISISPISGMSATNVQAAIAELKAVNGDMTKLVYDANNNGRIDNAETVNGFTIASSVPTGAQFTDNQSLSISGNNLSISGGNTVTLPTTVATGISSIGLSLPLYNPFPALSSNGTLSGSLTSQAANTVLAGPVSGASNVPSFRALGSDDIPSLDWSKITTGKPNTLAGYGINDALSNPMTSSGDLIYGGLAGLPTRLPKGNDGQILTLAGGIPNWVDFSPGGTVVLSGDITGNSTSTSIASGVIVPSDLNTSNSPANGNILSYNSGGTGGFTWITPSGTGDMLTSTYDQSGGAANGIVDLAETVSDGAINTNKITNNAVTATKIADQAITENHLSGITTPGVGGRVLASDGFGGFYWTTAGNGTVSSVSITPANGISGVVATAATTPAITLNLGAITPSSVTTTGNISATGTITGSNLSGTNTGDQTITLSGDLSGSGTGTINAQIASDAIQESDLKISNSGTNGQILSYNIATGGFTWINPNTNTGDMQKSVYDNIGGANGYVDVAETVFDNSITSGKIAADQVLEPHLKVSNLPVNGYLLSYGGANGFTWVAPGVGDMSKSVYDPDGDGVVTIPNNSITSAHITSNTINASDLQISNAGSNGNVLSYNSGTGGFSWVSTGTGDMTKSVYDNGNNGVVDIAETVSDNAITATKINANAVITAKIADGAVATAKLANDAVTTTKIADATITPADVNASGTPSVGNMLTYSSSTGFAWATPGTSGPLSVTTEQTGDYTATATDDIILFTGGSQHNLTLPTSGLTVGKIFYVSNSGLGGINIIPAPREQGAQTINGGTGGVLMFVGSGQYAVLSSF